jgi:aerobic-type carbon monoxide dehydrogenase small subunit (CoxS/CutS family)
LNEIPTESRKSAHIALRLNGESVEADFAPYKTLLEVLREDLALTGTKHGCELGECGACAVLLDGEPVLSCLVLALECDGREVLTVEGLASDARLHPLQDTFADLCRCTGYLQIFEAVEEAVVKIGAQHGTKKR